MKSIFFAILIIVIIGCERHYEYQLGVVAEKTFDDRTKRWTTVIECERAIFVLPEELDGIEIDDTVLVKYDSSYRNVVSVSKTKTSEADQQPPASED